MVEIIAALAFGEATQQVAETAFHLTPCPPLRHRLAFDKVVSGGEGVEG